jgi:hypothetical protein
MLTTILIIAFSFVMLLYWFRYSCILVLRNQAELKRTAAVPSQYDSADIQDRLQNAVELDPLHRELARDYRLLTYLVEHAAGLELAGFEHKLLVWDCRMMEFVYRITRTAAPEQARKALCEMAEVLGILGHHLQQQAGTATEI